MKAVVVHEFGSRDVLQVEDLPDPAPGVNEVVIDVTATALNHLDVDVREGVSRFPIEFPHTLGVEPVGRISALGEGVTGWSVGDRVAAYLIATCGTCVYCRTGRESLCTRARLVHRHGHGRRLRGEGDVQDLAADPDPRRRHRRRGGCEQHRLRDRLAHARDARQGARRRDRARQLRRQRDRIRGRAGRQARGRVRDRQLEPRRQAGEGEGARPRRRDQLHDAGRRRGGAAGDRRSGSRRRLRARRRRAVPEGARLARRRTAGSSSAGRTPARSSRSTSSRSSGGSSR